MYTAKILSYDFEGHNLKPKIIKNVFILTNLSSKRKKYIVILLLPFFVLRRCLHAREPVAISPKRLCLAVVTRMRETFLQQNKCWLAKVCKNRCPAVYLSKFLSQNKSRVGKVYKNRCPAVDLATFYRKI